MKYSPRTLKRRFGLEWHRLLLFALAAVVVLTLGTVGVTSTTAFGPYNPAWDGTSDFREEVESDPTVESELVRTTAEYEAVDPEGTIAFVVAPDEPYERTDAQRVASFVDEGGTLVVLANFDEEGNGLLAEVGANARTDGQLLRDEHNHYRGPAMPVATEVENHSLTTGVDQLTLNYATPVDPGSEDSTVLTATSNVTYRGDEDDTLDEQDELSSYPVATVENVSSGEVVVVGDPSIATNLMLDQPDNSAFVQALYATEEQVLFDVSHAEGPPPVIAAMLSFRDAPFLQVLLGITGIVTIAALANRRGNPALDRVKGRFSDRARSIELERELTESGLSTEEQVSYLRQRYPEWDEKQIQHVIRAVKRIQLKEEYDE